MRASGSVSPRESASVYEKTLEANIMWEDVCVPPAWSLAGGRTPWFQSWANKSKVYALSRISCSAHETAAKGANWIFEVWSNPYPLNELTENGWCEDDLLIFNKTSNGTW